MHKQSSLLQAFFQPPSQEGTCPSTYLGSLNQREQFPKHRTTAPTKRAGVAKKTTNFPLDLFLFRSLSLDQVTLGMRTGEGKDEAVTQQPVLSWCITFSKTVAATTQQCVSHFGVKLFSLSTLVEIRQQSNIHPWYHKEKLNLPTHTSTTGLRSPQSRHQLKQVVGKILMMNYYN